MNKHPAAPVPTAGRPLTAVGTNPPTMKCRECGGKGEAEYMGLCDRYYRWADCHSCNGTGLEAAYCGTCDGSLTATGFCMACDDFESGWLLAERSALGMVKP